MDPLGVLIILACLSIIGGSTAIFGWGAAFVVVGVLTLLLVYWINHS